MSVCGMPLFRKHTVAFLQKKRNETSNTYTNLIPPVYKTAFFRKLVDFLKRRKNDKNTKKGSLLPLCFTTTLVAGGNIILTTWERNKNFFAFAKVFEIETINLTRYSTNSMPDTSNLSWTSRINGWNWGRYRMLSPSLWKHHWPWVCWYFKNR